MPASEMVTLNLGETIIPVSAGGLPHPVVALIEAGHGPAPVVPCHKIVTGFDPGGEVIVPWLAGESVQLTVVPGGTPLNV